MGVIGRWRRVMWKKSGVGEEGVVEKGAFEEGVNEEVEEVPSVEGEEEVMGA